MATHCTDAAGRTRIVSWPLQILIGLAVTAALVTVAYLFVDEPLMSYIRSCNVKLRMGFKLLTRLPEAFVISSPFVLLACLCRRWFRPWTRHERTATAAAVSTLATALAAGLLKISFGRSIDGFHPFQIDSAYWWFPSGHTACTVSVTAVAQVVLPNRRLVCWSLAASVGTSLIALSHHFIGDIFGGAFLGWAIGGTSARLFGLDASVDYGPRPRPSSTVPVLVG